MLSGQQGKSDSEGLRTPGHRLNNIDIAKLGLATPGYVGRYGWIFPDSPIPRQALAMLISDDGQRYVQAFFVISGYLMYISFEHSNSTLYFFEKRFRRIYPTYFAVIIFSAFLGFWFSRLKIEEYISVDSVKYVFWNLKSAGVLQHSQGILSIPATILIFRSLVRDVAPRRKSRSEGPLD